MIYQGNFLVNNPLILQQCITIIFLIKVRMILDKQFIFADIPFNFQENSEFPNDTTGWARYTPLYHKYRNKTGEDMWFSHCGLHQKYAKVYSLLVWSSLEVCYSIFFIGVVFIRSILQYSLYWCGLHQKYTIVYFVNCNML